MNPYTGHLIGLLQPRRDLPAGYSAIPRALQAEAARALAGRSETTVDLTGGSSLAAWAKKKRKAKIAAASRREESEVSTAHSLGRFYVVFGAGQAGGSPLVDRCSTHEREEPYRIGAGFLIRLPFTGNNPTRGLVIGRWRNHRG